MEKGATRKEHLRRKWRDYGIRANKKSMVSCRGKQRDSQYPCFSDSPDLLLRLQIGLGNFL